jgi:hypothetical protein
METDSNTGNGKSQGDDIQSTQPQTSKEAPLHTMSLGKENTPVRKTPKKSKNKKIGKEAAAIGNKILDEGTAFGNQAKDIVLGTGREQEIKNLRLKKLERNKEVYLER